MSKKVLVIKTTYFVDPHGTPDLGGVEKFIANEGEYKSTPKDKYEQHDHICSEADLSGSEDGYNSEAYEYKVKKLSPERLEYVKSILKSYNKL
jgi:hypothetical protein